MKKPLKQEVKIVFGSLVLVSQSELPADLQKFRLVFSVNSWTPPVHIHFVLDLSAKSKDKMSS